jgi:thiol-disulfide isomerase/thioredoxin
MKRWFGGFIGAVFTAFLVTQMDAQSGSVQLRDYGPAPELHDSVWLNSPRALRLAELRGQVVLLHMWTFGCINCIRTLPYTHQWHDQYADQGLVVIGNHYPEFDYEADLNNLKQALVRLDVPYPVIQDNFRETWNAYNNRYWPTMYLIDKQGHIRYWHIGEGRYAQTEQAIQLLLAEEYTPDAAGPIEPLMSLTPIVEALNVRSGPGTSFGLLGSIEPGEVYAVQGEQDNWYSIRYLGQTGYVSGEFVKITS